MAVYKGKLKIAKGGSGSKERTCELRFDEKRNGWRLNLCRKGAFGKLVVEETIDLKGVERLKLLSKAKFELSTTSATWSCECPANDALHWRNAIVALAPQITVSVKDTRLEKDLPIFDGVKEKRVHGSAWDYVSVVGEGDTWYLISRTKGKGGYGKFRHAMALDDDQLVAVKEFRVSLFPGFEPKAKTYWTDYNKLKVEIAAMAACKSRIRFVRLIKVEKKYYGVMPLMLTDLDKLLEAGLCKVGTDDLRKIARFIMREIAADLENVHAAKYVFCDLKPENVLVDYNGVVLADYGVVEKIDVKGECHGVTGSPGFIPPEMYPKVTYTAKRDIFTLGMIWAQLFFRWDGVHFCLNELWPTYDMSINSVSTKLPKLDAEWSKYMTKDKQKMFARPVFELVALWQRIKDPTVDFDTPKPDPSKGLGEYLRHTLGRVRKVDPQLFDFVWKKMLCPDPKDRCDAKQVKEEAAKLLAGKENEALKALQTFIDSKTKIKAEHKQSRDTMLKAKQAVQRSAPWDEQNVKQNLQVLKRLKKGDRLSVLEDQRRTAFARPSLGDLGAKGQGLRDVFVIESGSAKTVKQSRKDKGESLLDDRQTMLPILAVFRAAIAMYQTRHRAGIRKPEIVDALDGLRRMAETYRKSFGKNTKYTYVTSMIHTIELLIASSGGITREVGLVKLGGSREVDLLHEPVLGKLKQSLAAFVEAAKHKDRSKEAKGTNNQRVAVYGSTSAGTTQVQLPGGGSYKRSGLGICEDALAGWPQHGIQLNNSALKFDESNLEKDVKTLYEALGKDDGLLFYVSLLTCVHGLPGVIKLLFTHKYPKNVDAKKLKPIFAVGDTRFFPFDVDSTFSVDTSSGIKVSVRSVADKDTLIHRYEVVDDFVVIGDTSTVKAPEEPTETDHLASLGISELAVQLEVGLQRKGAKIEVELRQAKVKTQGSK